MPERLKARELLATVFIGERHGWYTGEHPPLHRCKNAPECGLPADAHEAEKARNEGLKKADDLYVRLVNLLDWDRILGIAQDRHDQFHSKDELGPAEIVCHECLKEAMLSTALFNYGWPKDIVESPRNLPLEDF